MANNDEFILHRRFQVPMTNPEKDDLQRLARLVEINKDRLQKLETQLQNLDNIRIEQSHALDALNSISEDGAKDAMIPLGAGVQLIADINADSGAVVDIGSRVQAEKTREEAVQILKNRNEEIISIIEKIKLDYDELEKQVVTLATEFNERIESIKQEPEGTSPTEAKNNPEPKRKSRRRKRGTELTLDD